MRATKPDRKRLLSYHDISEIYGIPSRTLYRWIKMGHFPKPMRVSGRKRLWHRDDLTEWENTSR